MKTFRLRGMGVGMVADTCIIGVGMATASREDILLSRCFLGLVATGNCQSLAST
jgi:hypothetical protein